MPKKFSFIDPHIYSPELTHEEMALRELFAEEYVRDYDAYRACLRMGFQAPYAEEWSKTLMQDAYVNRLLEIKKTERIAETPEAEVAQDEALIKSVLRQASQNGPYATRVAAATQLAKLHGLGKVEGNGDEALVELLKNFAGRAPV